MKKILSLRTKAEVVFVAWFLVGISAFSVMSVTRTITDTSDTIDTYIRNSNGNYWEATGANLQLALDDVDDDRGTVWLPSGEVITTSITLSIENNVTLDCQGATLQPDGDFDCIDIAWSGCIKNVIIDLSVATYSNTTAGIHPRAYEGTPLESGREGFLEDKILMGENILIKGDIERRGLGIYVNPTVSGHDFGYTVWHNLNFRDIHKAIYFLVDTAGTYVNYNTFTEVSGGNCRYFIYLEETTVHEISMNTFSNVRYEAGSYGYEYYPIYIEGNCDNNIFSNIGLMDWDADGETTEAIYLSGAEPQTNWFSGSYLPQNLVADNGGGNSYFAKNLTVKGISLSTGGSAGRGINPGMDGNTGVPFYFGTAGNPVTYFYGNDGGSGKFGYLQVASTGEFRVASDTGEVLALTPSQGDNTQYVRIDDILKLDGRTTDPPTLIEGMIWYNTTANLFYCRAGGSSYTFNLTAV